MFFEIEDAKKKKSIWKTISIDDANPCIFANDGEHVVKNPYAHPVFKENAQNGRESRFLREIWKIQILGPIS